MRVWRLYGKQAAVRVSIRKLACTQPNSHMFMKKEMILGTKSMPTARVSVGKRFRELINRTLPSECQIQTAQDAWYVGAIGALCVTFVFPPAVAVAAYCVYRAKKEGGER